MGRHSGGWIASRMAEAGYDTEDENMCPESATDGWAGNSRIKAVKNLQLRALGPLCYQELCDCLNINRIFCAVELS